MISNYSSCAQKLNVLIEEIKKHIENNNQLIALERMQDNLIHNQFVLVVLGQFKRGKTTLINALLGGEILPTGIAPMTSIITIIKYGKQLKIKVFAMDWEKEIPLQDLPLYTTEANNPKNEKNISHVEVEYPSSFLLQGASIVDTPGIGSIHEHNTKLTHSYLPNADAAIFLISPDPPITQIECDFLKDIRYHVAKIFFVHNKIDKVTADECEESIAFSRTVIEKIIGSPNIVMYPVSAYNALAGKLHYDAETLMKSNLLPFEDQLKIFLMTKKGLQICNNIINKLLTIVREELLIAQIKLKSFAISLQESEEKSLRTLNLLKETEQQRMDNVYLLNGEIRQLQSFLLRDIEQLKQNKMQPLLRELLLLYDMNKNQKSITLGKFLENCMRSYIEEAFSSWIIEEGKRLEEMLTAILDRFAIRMASLHERIISLISRDFDFSLDSYIQKQPIKAEINLIFELDEIKIHLEELTELLTRLLPRQIAKKLILQKAIRQAEMLFDKHCGRARYAFSQKIDQIASEFGILQENIIKLASERILQTIQMITAEKEHSTQNAVLEEAALLNKIERLNTINAELVDFSGQVAGAV